MDDGIGKQLDGECECDSTYEKGRTMPMNRIPNARRAGPAYWKRCTSGVRMARLPEPSWTTVQQAKILVADPAYPSPPVVDLIAELMSNHLLPLA